MIKITLILLELNKQLHDDNTNEQNIFDSMQNQMAMYFIRLNDYIVENVKSWLTETNEMTNKLKADFDYLKDKTENVIPLIGDHDTAIDSIDK